MAGVMVSTAVDAAGNLDLQLTQIRFLRRQLHRQFLGDGDGAGIGQGAIIKAGAGNDVRRAIQVGGGQPGRNQHLPQIEQIGAAHVRQHKVLRVGHADFVAGVTLGQIGDDIHLIGRRVAGDFARCLQADGDDGIAGRLVGMRVHRHPVGEIRVGLVDLDRRVGIKHRRREVRGDTGQFRRRRIEA